MAQKSFRILIVDRDNSIPDKLREYANSFDAAWGVDFTHVENPTLVLQKLSNNPFDILITEYDFEDITGLDLLQDINELEWSKPIIMMTDNGSEKIAARALRRGATDYRIKNDLTPQTFKQSIELALKKYLESSRQQKRQRQLQEEAGQDEVTGLNNRRELRDRIEEHLKDAKNNNNDLSLFMLALKNFDQINAIHGQETGDMILDRIGNFISKNVRDEDVPGRYQGVEFCISMPNTEKSKAKMLAKRFLNQFEKTLSDIEDEYNISVAYGGTIIERKAGENEVDAIMKRAVEQLYQAKVDVNENELVVSE